jgi:hypothetical protein
MEYYIFRDCNLARRTDFYSKCEWLVNGVWIENSSLTRGLNDAMMGFGNYSTFDYDHIAPEIAEKLIQTGTTVLQKVPGHSGSKTIQLSNWKKPNL